jgi:hypothetical protein
MITAITPTGDRPLPFGLCVEYMARQTRKPDQWVIVDDGRVPLAQTGEDLQQRCGIADVQIVRRLPERGDPPHTLPVNLLTALERVASPRLAFIEDDDWYSPHHIERLDDDLRTHELAGSQGIVYYHVVKRCHRVMGASSPHSSLCQTGMTASVIPLLRRICASIDTGFVDLLLWRGFTGDKKLTKDPGTVVGIKGLPGRAGLTMGWRSHEGYTPDPSMAFLESLIGRDVENYRARARGCAP